MFSIKVFPILLVLVQCCVYSFADPINIVLPSASNLDEINLKDLTSEGTENIETEGGEDTDGDVGYIKKTDSVGADGYQKYETFENKDGDAYGYEKHEAFGETSKEDSDSKDADGAVGYQVTEDQKEYDDHEGGGDDSKEAQIAADEVEYDGDSDEGSEEESLENYKESDESEDDGKDHAASDEKTIYQSVSLEDVKGQNKKEGGETEGHDAHDDNGAGHAKSLDKNVYETHVVHKNPKIQLIHNADHDSLETPKDIGVADSDPGSDEVHGALNDGSYQNHVTYGSSDSGAHDDKHSEESKDANGSSEKDELNVHEDNGVNDDDDEGGHISNENYESKDSYNGSPVHYYKDDDNGDDGQGQQYTYASEADSDAYY